MFPSPLNAIIDVDVAERAGWTPVDLASAYINGGARFLQVRAKSLSGAAFLIRDGRVLAAAVREIDIRKSGFERFVEQAAEHDSLAYGLVAVALSVLFGWAAGSLWRRF